MEQYKQRTNAQTYAENLFDRSWFTGRVKWLLAQITRQSRLPLFLNSVDGTDVETEFLERQAVPLNKIKGNSGRADRFDKDFHPIHRRDRNRWVSVAVAMMTDATDMPPIEVVQIGDVYYVTDGNHRVSAAKALKKLFIDANVTRWHFPAD